MTMVLTRGARVVIAAVLCAGGLSTADTCTSQALQNRTAYGVGQGKQLGNFTFDLHPEQVGDIGNQTCCSAASGAYTVDMV